MTKTNIYKNLLVMLSVPTIREVLISFSTHQCTVSKTGLTYELNQLTEKKLKIWFDTITNEIMELYLEFNQEPKQEDIELGWSIKEKYYGEKLYEPSRSIK